MEVEVQAQARARSNLGTLDLVVLEGGTYTQ
jgi:hypothetical protein